MDDNEATAEQPQELQAGRYREIGLRAVAAALLCQGAVSDSESPAASCGDHDP